MELISQPSWLRSLLAFARDEDWNLAAKQLPGSFLPQARGLEGQLLSGEIEEDGWDKHSLADSEEDSEEWESEEDDEGEGSSEEGSEMDAGDVFLEV